MVNFYLRKVIFVEISSWSEFSVSNRRLKAVVGVETLHLMVRKWFSDESGL